MMAKPTLNNLSRRERQIMDVIFKAGQATAADVYAALPDPPKETTIRKLIRVLEEKGYVTHKSRGREFVYRPTVPRGQASRKAVKHLMDTFFEGSAPKAVAALLNASKDSLSAEEVQELAALIDKAAKEGR